MAFVAAPVVVEGGILAAEGAALAAPIIATEGAAAIGAAEVGMAATGLAALGTARKGFSEAGKLVKEGKNVVNIGKTAHKGGSFLFHGAEKTASHVFGSHHKNSNSNSTSQNGEHSL
jgi:hypothetical protein